MNVKNSVFSDTVAAWLLLLYSNLILRLCIEEEGVRRALEKVGEEIMIPQKAIKTWYKLKSFRSLFGGGVNSIVYFLENLEHIFFNFHFKSWPSFIESVPAFHFHLVHRQILAHKKSVHIYCRKTICRKDLLNSSAYSSKTSTRLWRREISLSNKLHS